jgi:hypothetical protein
MISSNENEKLPNKDRHNGKHTLPQNLARLLLTVVRIHTLASSCLSASHLKIIVALNGFS